MGLECWVQLTGWNVCKSCFGAITILEAGVAVGAGKGVA